MLAKISSALLVHTKGFWISIVHVKKLIAVGKSTCWLTQLPRQSS
jgi:hypothetical protein